MKSSHFWNLSLPFSLALSIPLSHAQALPDAGSIRQQLEQPRGIPLPPAAPPRTAPAPAIQTLKGVTVRIQTFRFAGNTKLSAADLSAATVSFLDRDLDFDGLQRAADAVAAAYREAGWIVRVYLPEQDITTGVLTLQVVEAKAASYLVAGDNRKSVSEAESKVLGSVAMASMPGVALPNAQAPQPLVMASASSGDSSSGSATTGSTTGANSSGVTVDLQNVGQQDTPLMVAVSLPKGASTVGTGFSFELPASVKGITSADTEVLITQPNGSALPSWLKFDRERMRFEASAVPDSALPMQLVVTLAGRRVMVVISERTE